MDLFSLCHPVQFLKFSLFIYYPHLFRPGCLNRVANTLVSYLGEASFESQTENLLL